MSSRIKAFKRNPLANLRSSMTRRSPAVILDTSDSSLDARSSASKITSAFSLAEIKRSSRKSSARASDGRLPKIMCIRRPRHTQRWIRLEKQKDGYAPNRLWRNIGQTKQLSQFVGIGEIFFCGFGVKRNGATGRDTPQRRLK